MARFAIVVSLFTSACFGTIDGGGDPMMDDDPMMNPPPPTDVRINVHDSEGPIAGLAVVFLDANDAVAADIVTDAQGTAVAKLATGSVTVIRPGAVQPTMGGNGSVYTYVGVKAGDQLDLALAPDRASNPITVNVTVPLTENQTAVQITTPCGSGIGVPPTVAVTLDGCGTETDFYVTELDGEQASFLKRAQITDPIDLSTEIYRAALTSTLSVTNAPADAAVAIEKRIETDLFRPVFSTGPLAVSPDQPIDVTVPDLPGTEELLFAGVSYQGAVQIVGSRDAYPGGPAVVDLSAAMIIAPSKPMLAGDTLTWTEQGSGAPDTVIATVQSETVAHYVAAPYAGASLKVPHLPAAHDAFNMKSGDTPSIALAKIGGGFDGVRARVFAGPLAPMGGAVTIAVTSLPTDPRQ